MRAFATLIWEQWRQTWRGLLLIALALAGYWGLLVMVEQLIFIAFSKNPRIALAAAYVPVVGAMGLLFMQESRSQIGFAYPRRMFWLPVHTYSLVAAQFVYKLAVIALFAAAAGWICNTEIKITFAIMPQVAMFTGITAALLGLVFLTCGYGAGTGLAIFLPSLVLSLIAFHPVYTSAADSFTVVQPPSAAALADIGETVDTYIYFVYPYASPWLWWGAGATLIFWAVAAYVGARQARSEVPEDRVGRLVRVLSNVAHFDRESEAFATPEAAHRWFEWRRMVYLYPWLTLALGILMVLTLRSSMEEEENKFGVTLSMFALAPAVVAVILGYTMTRPDPRYMWFVGGRPLTTATIARVRLIVCVRAIVTAYVLAFIAYTVAIFVLFGSTNPLNAIITDLELITTTYGMGHNPLISVAAGLWIALIGVWTMFWVGRSAGVVAWIAGLLAGAYFYLTGGQVYDVVDAYVVSPIWIAFGGTLTVLALISLIATYAFVIWRGLISVKVVPILVAMFGLSAGSVYHFREVFNDNAPVLAIGIWLLVPLLPFASVPATLTWQRHR